MTGARVTRRHGSAKGGRGRDQNAVGVKKVQFKKPGSGIYGDGSGGGGGLSDKRKNKTSNTMKNMANQDATAVEKSLQRFKAKREKAMQDFENEVQRLIKVAQKKTREDIEKATRSLDRVMSKVQEERDRIIYATERMKSELVPPDTIRVGSANIDKHLRKQMKKMKKIGAYLAKHKRPEEAEPWQ